MNMSIVNSEIMEESYSTSWLPKKVELIIYVNLFLDTYNKVSLQGQMLSPSPRLDQDHSWFFRFLGPTPLLSRHFLGRQFLDRFFNPGPLQLAECSQ